MPTRFSATDYWVDASQRAALVLDALRRRGNAYLEHVESGAPPLLKFDHQVVLDGRQLPRPCNYALLRIVPPPDFGAEEPSARPVIVVDPRAGHGPGIGGFKLDSEVGVAMRSGHPVYFVTFRPQPEEGQTLVDVMHAEARFIEEVAARHPHCKDKPIVIGNCQAGWAIAALAARRPEIFGVVTLVGAPLSYWAGGEKLNPMRYTGALLGGAWLAALTADTGADRFDGAHLVQNFEGLNPANAWWTKYRKLWREVDTETERFLDFERWWGGFFRMTGGEIEWIVENLFVGNKLARGDVEVEGEKLDLRNITAPIVVFASWGDNITPPPQALNWIIDTWGDERAITEAGRTIVYVLHEHVGHLGIFVGADVARKEHDQIVSSIDVIEALPPGLYEMKVERKDGLQDHRWEDLEPGDYSVHFEHRRMDDVRAVNPEGRAGESLFATVAAMSEINTALYKTWLRPWIRAFTPRPIADALGQLHPLRLQRQMLSDRNPFAAWADQARAARRPVEEAHPLRELEQTVSDWVTTSLDMYRDAVQHWTTAWSKAFYGAAQADAHTVPRDEQAAVARAGKELEAARTEELARVHEGGFAEAVCRIVLAGMLSIGSFERRSFRIAGLLAQLPLDGVPGGRDAGAHDRRSWIRLLKEQARITAVAPVEALTALGDMLPGTAERERALAIAAAVLMIEPTLAHPRSEIIEYLIAALGVDAERVIELARALTAPLEGHLQHDLQSHSHSADARADEPDAMDASADEPDAADA